MLVHLKGVGLNVMPVITIYIHVSTFKGSGIECNDSYHNIAFLLYKGNKEIFVYHSAYEVQKEFYKIYGEGEHL